MGSVPPERKHGGGDALHTTEHGRHSWLNGPLYGSRGRIEWDTSEGHVSSSSKCWCAGTWSTTIRNSSHNRPLRRIFGVQPDAIGNRPLPSSVSALLSVQVISTITSATWFPTTIAESFIGALHEAFYLNAGLAIVAALASFMRGNELLSNNETSTSDLRKEYERNRAGPADVHDARLRHHPGQAELE